MSDTIELTYENDDGEEVTLTLPSKMEVCDECGGHGYVLCEGMRGHAYTSEEFAEAFDDDEDRAEYFRYGGKYDQQCPVCKGKNVVPGVDESRLSDAQKKEYAEYQEWQEAEWQADADCRAETEAERRMGC